ncbi:MAG: hypothetical protein FWG20_02700 [Candidatus Cloacimonetes bacterium]|nr:hypothetical protein [Candidatus Cloacimonadota bacterium]
MKDYKYLLYFDPSAWGYLDEPNYPEIEAYMRTIHTMLSNDDFIMLFSNVGMFEVEDNPDKVKVARLKSYLEKINYIYLKLDAEIENIANLLYEAGLLTSPKKIE